MRAKRSQYPKKYNVDYRQIAVVLKTILAEYLSEPNETGETKLMQFIKKAVNKEYTTADFDALLKLVKLLTDKDENEVRNLVLQIEQGSAQSIAEFIKESNGSK